jgi:plastocyanin
MQTARALASIAIAATLTLSGCKPDAALKHAETIDQSSGPRSTPTNLSNTPTALIDTSTFGQIRGTIHFSGAAPKPLKIDMSMDPACGLSKMDNMAEQYTVSGNKLANVLIYIKSGIAPTTAAPDAPHVILDQKGCRYTPHVIAVQQGASVEFHNSDPTMHNIHITSDSGGTFDVSQAPLGQPQTQQFNTPGIMMPIRCNNHPWMNAFINVIPTPYFDVTRADGNFTITGLPPGTYTLAAVHEKLGEQDVQVIVPAKSTAKEDFTFTAK